MSKTIHDLKPEQVAQFIETIQKLVAVGLKRVYGIDTPPYLLIGMAHDGQMDNGMLMGNMPPDGMARMKQVLQALEDAGGIPVLERMAKGEVHVAKDGEMH